MIGRGKFILILVLLFLYNAVLAQQKAHLYKMNYFGADDDNYRVDWKWTGKMLDSIGIHDILYGDKEFIIRLRTGATVIEIWTTNNLKYQGKLYNYTILETDPQIAYAIVEKIDDTLIERIMNLFNHLEVNKFIKGETFKRVGNRGNILQFDDFRYESNIKGIYYFGTHPMTQHTITRFIGEENIDSFFSFISKNLMIEPHYVSFIKNLPDGTYFRCNSNVGDNVIIKKTKGKKVSIRYGSII